MRSTLPEMEARQVVGDVDRQHPPYRIEWSEATAKTLYDLWVEAHTDRGDALKALRKYGGHAPNCAVTLWFFGNVYDPNRSDKQPDCTCEFEEFMTPPEPPHGEVAAPPGANSEETAGTSSRGKQAGGAVPAGEGD